MPTALTLRINGVDYNLAARSANLLRVDGWGWDLDGDFSMEFSELCPDGSLVPRWNGSHPCSLTGTIAGSPVLLFSGQIAAAEQFFHDEGVGYGYQCLGFKYVGNQLPVVAIDGTNRMLFNLSPLEEGYVLSNSGLTIGQILSAALTQHATALTAAGITTDATTTAQLAALTLVPPEPVVISGSRFMQALDAPTQKWARNVIPTVLPSGLLRFVDTTVGTGITLTYGTDNITYPSFSRDWKDCATRCQVVGGGNIYGAYVSLLKGDLGAAWSAPNQAAWKWDDYAKPGDAYDEGTVTTILSPTTIRVTSSNPLVHWVLNFWSARKAWIYLKKSLGTGITYQESRPITSCTAMTAGGTSDITVAFDLENAGASAYDTWSCIGNVADLGGGGLNSVWRLFNVLDPGGLIANHLVTKFATSQPFFGYGGTSQSNTFYPQAVIVKAGVTTPATFKIIPTTGQILFDQPIAAAYTTKANLDTGGASVTAPDDIYVLLAYSRGALAATAPADISGVPQYQGTAYTVDGLARTKTLPVDSWVYAGNSAMMTQLAQMYLDASKDTVLTGSLTAYGLLDAFRAPGILLSVASTRGTTGYESSAIPVRAVRFEPGGEGSDLGRTTIRLSSRRNPRTGDRAYNHTTSLNQLGFKMDLGGASIDMSGMRLNTGGLANLPTSAGAGIAAGYGGGGDLGIPMSLGEAGVDVTGGFVAPTQGDLGIPQDLGQAGVDITGGFGQ